MLRRRSLHENAPSEKKKSTSTDKENPNIARKICDFFIPTSTYYLTNIIFLRFLGLLFFTAYNVALFQNIALLGSHGLVPACKAAGFSSDMNKFTWNEQTRAAFLTRPSLFWFFGCNDEVLTWVALVGVIMSLIPLLFGTCNVIILFTLWIGYASFINLQSTWFSFGWETQLLETSIWCAFSLPIFSLKRVDPITGQSLFLISFIYKLLIAKIMLGAGLIKIRGDDCWRDIWGKNCMLYHYETQPNPHILSSFYHYLPHSIHSFETLSNHVIELLAPILLLPFLPRFCRLVAGMLFVFFQIVLISTGNLAFLNWLTIVPALYCFDDQFWAPIFPASIQEGVRKASHISREMNKIILDKLLCQSLSKTNKRIKNENNQDGDEEEEEEEIDNDDDKLKQKPHRRYIAPLWQLSFFTVRGLLTLLGFIYYSYLQEPIVHNLLSKRQAMNRSFDAWHISNTYGAFGSIGKIRTEVVYSGKGEDDEWREFEFFCKPGALSKRPCVITPYHLRLDWSAWFSAMATYQHYPWTVHFVQKMLEPRKKWKMKQNFNMSVVKFLRKDLGLPIAIDVRDLILYTPFNETKPPIMIKALLYEYRFTPLSIASIVKSLPFEKNNDYMKNATALGKQLCSLLPSWWEWKVAAPKSTKCIATAKWPQKAPGGPYFEVTTSDGGAVIFEAGLWYTRRLLSEYLPPIEAGNPSVKEFLRGNGLI